MTRPAPTTYTDWAASRLPRWLRGGIDGWGDRFIRGFGEVLDAIADGMRAAVKVRHPSTTPEDAVPYLGAERHLTQYPSETLAAWRERIGRAWEQWAEAGTPASLLSQLERYGIGHVEVLEHAVDPVTPGDGNARFVVVLGDGVDAGSLPWSPLTMPFTPSGPDVTLGSTATAEEVSQVRAIVRQWKAAHSLTVATILRFVGGVVADPFWPRDPANPECTWTGARCTLGIGIQSMPFVTYGYHGED